MHGFFIDARLYKKVKALSDPFAYEQYRKEKIRKRVEERQGQRIVMKKKNALPVVNPKLAKRLLRAEKKSKKSKKKIESGKDEENGESAIIDPRFAGIFQDADFQIDEESEDFKRLYSTGMSAASAGALKAGDNDDDDDDDEESESEEGEHVEEEESLEPGSLRFGTGTGFTVVKGKRTSESVLGKASLVGRSVLSPFGGASETADCWHWYSW